jgi:hypothetical protein
MAHVRPGLLNAHAKFGTADAKLFRPVFDLAGFIEIDTARVIVGPHLMGTNTSAPGSDSLKGARDDGATAIRP